MKPDSMCVRRKGSLRNGWTNNLMRKCKIHHANYDQIYLSCFVAILLDGKRLDFH